MTHPDSEALLRRAQAGDGESQDKLLALIRPDLERLASVYSDRASAAESTQAALKCIANPAGREIVRFRFYEGLSLRQVAQRLGLGYDQVRQRYQIIIRRLERELGGMS